MLDDHAVSLRVVEVRRSKDAAEVNRVLNDPSVFPHITLPGLEKLDASDILADDRNVALVADDCAILFVQHEPGQYEVHTNFIRKKQPDGLFYTRDVCLAAYRWMFTHTDCMMLVGRVPAFNRALKLLRPHLHWTHEFDRKAVWPTKDGPVDMSFYTLSYEVWFRNTPDLAEVGRTFHDKLDDEFERHKVEHVTHPDEECHNRAVGACAEMVYGGQPEKGIVLYNRWAKFAGYGPLAIIARNPLLIDIGDAVLKIVDHDFEVILCRSAAQS